MQSQKSHQSFVGRSFSLSDVQMSKKKSENKLNLISICNEYFQQHWPIEQCWPVNLLVNERRKKLLPELNICDILLFISFHRSTTMQSPSQHQHSRTICIPHRTRIIRNRFSFKYPFATTIITRSPDNKRVKLNPSLSSRKLKMSPHHCPQHSLRHAHKVRR